MFNEGTCRFGTTCKFAHKCALCGGPHRRMNCSRGGEEKEPRTDCGVSVLNIVIFVLVLVFIYLMCVGLVL